MKPNTEIGRRKVLGTIGGLAVAGSGLAALSGGAAASDTTLEGPDETVTATTDDGSIMYVAYGGRLRFEWDGLDTEATHGEYVVQSRVRDHGGEFTDWRFHGKGSGPLGDDADADGHDGDGVFEEGEGNSANSWGGDNESNSGPGTDGYFQFKYGSAYGQRDYAIAYDGDHEEILPVKNPWHLNRFEEATDGGKQTTQVEIRKTCRVYDGDPSEDSSSVLVADKDSARMLVEVQNRPATGTTGGEVSGTIGADES